MLGFSLKYILESLQECAKMKMFSVSTACLGLFSPFCYKCIYGVFLLSSRVLDLSHPPEAGKTSSAEWLRQWRSSPPSRFPSPSHHLASECRSVQFQKTWAVLHLNTMTFGHLLTFKDCFFSFSFFYRGDNDEEEPAKLKTEHHDLSVAGLQSPGKPCRQVCRMWHVTY